MELENRKRRARRITVITRVLNYIRIKRTRARSYGREILPMLGRARERACEAPSIGLAGGVDAGVVDAEIGAELGD